MSMRANLATGGCAANSECASGWIADRLSGHLLFPQTAYLRRPHRRRSTVAAAVQASSLKSPQSNRGAVQITGRPEDGNSTVSSSAADTCHPSGRISDHPSLPLLPRLSLYPATFDTERMLSVNSSAIRVCHQPWSMVLQRGSFGPVSSAYS